MPELMSARTKCHVFFSSPSIDFNPIIDLFYLFISFNALKLRALSHILQTPIEVVQMDSPPIIVGEEYSNKPIILV